MTVTILNAFGVNNNVSKVQWPSGVFIIVDVKANYVEVTSPLRTVEIFIEPAIGEVLTQRNIQEPLTGLHAQRSRFLAVIKIKKLPKAGLTASAFALTLRGAARKTTPAPPFSVTYFCGTTTYTQTTSYQVIANPFAEGQFILVAHVVWAGSSPAGASTVAWDYEVAGIGLDEALAKYNGKSFSFSASSQEAWYQDPLTGIFYNARFPCDEIPLPGDPQPSTVFEGFYTIIAQVVASSGMKSTDSVGWTGDTLIDDILIPDPDKDTFDGRRLSRTTIGRILAGVTDFDHIPFYSDLPNGIYNFNLERDTFKNITPTPKANPTDPDPPPFKQVIAWPTTIASCKYRLLVQGPKPDFLDYFMPENLADPTDWDRKIPAGLPPPSNQVFST